MKRRILSRSPRQLPRLAATLCAIAATAAACATYTPPPQTGEVPQPPEPAPVSDPDAPISITLSGAQHRYEVASLTNIYDAQDSTALLDRVQVTANLHLSANLQSSELTLRGEVTTLEIIAGEPADQRLTRASQPLPFDLSLGSARLLTGDTTAAAPCDAITESATELVLGIFPVIPSRISKEDSWRGETTVITCRGGVRIRVISTSNYRVSDHATASRIGEVDVLSTTSISLTGAGKQGATDVELRGEGTGSGSCALTVTAGALRNCTYRTRILITVDLGYREERLIQETVRTVRLLPDGELHPPKQLHFP